MTHDRDTVWMRRALELARLGEGVVEPNPMVGCVLVRQGVEVGSGWHERYGQLHAEVNALAAAGEAARGATAYVTLEPCAHHGKTPPCTDALIHAGVARVVAAMTDPFPEVSGRGLRRLAEAGIAVESGLLRQQAERLNAPYLTRLRLGRPWVIAKWAMTLDGKLAAADGDSRWISNETSRARVHALRARVDGLLVGSNTVLRDDPLLTARPPEPRQPTRMVADRRLRIPLDSRLVETCRDHPLLILTSESADPQRRAQLERAGAELLVLGAELDDGEFLSQALRELGSRQMTNLLVEGGADLLAALLDADLLDEVWAFVAPKLVGGATAPSPLAGTGRAMSRAISLVDPQLETLDKDVLIRGILRRPEP